MIPSLKLPAPGSPIAASARLLVHQNILRSRGVGFVSQPGNAFSTLSARENIQVGGA
jgi:ABC-type lipoprotein export system ATPase subunit